jgi:hypothetical protein
MMPHQGRGTEADRPSLFLDAPADINIVTGYTELWIESINLFQSLSPEGHVASRNVLG